VEPGEDELVLPSQGTADAVSVKEIRQRADPRTIEQPSQLRPPCLPGRAGMPGIVHEPVKVDDVSAEKAAVFEQKPGGFIFRQTAAAGSFSPLNHGNTLIPDVGHVKLAVRIKMNLVDFG
jgi:hypothetical protein